MKPHPWRGGEGRGEGQALEGQAHAPGVDESLLVELANDGPDVLAAGRADADALARDGVADAEAVTEVVQRESRVAGLEQRAKDPSRKFLIHDVASHMKTKRLQRLDQRSEPKRV
jgi:hypothetical protein